MKALQFFVVVFFSIGDLLIKKKERKKEGMKAAMPKPKILLFARIIYFDFL